MNADDSDGALVRAARQGDRTAFAMLLERHRPVLLALCTRLLHNRALAEDVAQEAALRAFLSLDRLRQVERFGAWLSGIGLNLARHYLTDQRQHPWSLDALVGGRQVHEPIDCRPDPVELAVDAELAARVRQAVAELPRGQKAAVLLSYLSGLTHAEAAAALGVEVGAVKQRLHKARVALRWRLAPTWKDENVEADRQAQLVDMRIADIRRVPPEGDRTVQYIVLLEEVSGVRRLPIWVGRSEGEALALGLEKVQLPRPPTFAFTASLLQAAGAQLREVVLNRLADKVFYAQAIVGIGRAARSRAVDARPSDALNLALLVGAPIRVSAEVFAEAEKPEQSPPWPRPDPYAEGTTGAKEVASEIVQAYQFEPTPPR